MFNTHGKSEKLLKRNVAAAHALHAATESETDKTICYEIFVAEKRYEPPLIFVIKKRIFKNSTCMPLAFTFSFRQKRQALTQNVE